MSNIIESIIIGGLAIISPVARILLRNKWNNQRVAIALLIFVCVIAISIWKYVPALPE